MHKPKMSDVDQMGKYELLYDTLRINRLLVAEVKGNRTQSLLEQMMFGAPIVYIQRLGRN